MKSQLDYRVNMFFLLKAVKCMVNLVSHFKILQIFVIFTIFVEILFAVANKKYYEFTQLFFNFYNNNV